jgi:hypothetical protein
VLLGQTNDKAILRRHVNQHSQQDYATTRSRMHIKAEYLSTCKLAPSVQNKNKQYGIGYNGKYTSKISLAESISILDAIKSRITNHSILAMQHKLQ